MARTGPAPPAVLGTPQTVFAYTPSDTGYCPFVPDWIWVGGNTGTMSMAFPGNPGPVIVTVPTTGRIDFKPTRIFAASTTATGIVIVKDGDLSKAR